MKTIITLAVLSLLAVSAMRAEVITKGGATALLRDVPVSSGPAATAMACPQCKSDFAARTTFATKGTAPSTAIVERHLCSGCDTKIVTTGGGKAKVETARHACAGCNS